MKKIVYNRIDTNTVEKILSMSIELNNDTEQYEGALLDNYIIYNKKRISLGKAKGREYIIAREKYLNEWSSCYELIFTDDIKEIENWRKIFKCDDTQEKIN